MIGDRIKELRARNGLTRADLSRRLQISRSAVNAWEMGISVPSTQYVVELASLFRVTTDFLLDRTSEETLDISELNEGEKELLTRMLQYFSAHRYTVGLLERHGIKPEEEELEGLHAPLLSYYKGLKDLEKKGE